MQGHDIIVIGASAGGVEALIALVRTLPSDLPAALFVVLHIPAQSPSLLPEILSRVGVLPATQAKDELDIHYGHIYVAPPDHHLLLERGRMCVVHGPKENRHRPAIDPLFRSAAYAYSNHVVGVVLTGALDDGTAGLQTIKQYGGITVVQDPKEALYPSMPLNALMHVNIDYTLPLAEISPLLQHLAQTPVEKERSAAMPEHTEKEIKSAAMDRLSAQAIRQTGTPSVFSCPECGGVLWEIHDGDLLRFRCRVGHAFSIESVLAGQSEALENALWVALKTLEEQADLSRRIAERAQRSGQARLSASFLNKVQEAEQRITLIRKALQLKDDKEDTEQAFKANRSF